MKEIIKVGETKNSNDVISSLELVKQINVFRGQEGNKSDLLHKNLLSVIRDEFEEEIQGLEIKPSFIIRELANGGSKKDIYFNLTLNQAKQLLMRESKFVRKAMIQYIDALESEIRNKFKVPTTFREALLLAAEQQEIIENQQKQIGVMKPKEEFYDAVTGSNDTIDMRTVATVLNCGLGRNRIFEILRDKKILDRRNLPYQSYIDRGYFRTIESTYTKPDGTNCVNIKTVVFQKGLDYIRKILNKKY